MILEADESNINRLDNAVKMIMTYAAEPQLPGPHTRVIDLTDCRNSWWFDLLKIYVPGKNIFTFAN